jgi:DNA primase
MPEPTLRKLKQRVSIEHVLAARGLLRGLRPQGDRLVGCCPIHRGDSPNAFVVTRSRGLWYCFTGCQAGGDVVELLRRLDRCSYGEVARQLLALAGTAPPDTAARPSPGPRRFQPFTHALPLDHASALLRHKGIRPDTARAFEAGTWAGGGFLRGCLAVRLHDPSGFPLGYAGRRLDPQEVRTWGKWKLPPAFPRNQTLYGYHRVATNLPRSGVVVVVECPWGVMRLAQLGVPAVALLGTHVSDPQQALIRRAPAIVLLLDADPAGRQASVRIQQSLQLPAVRIAELPDGRDPDDLDDRALAAIVEPHLPPTRSHPIK